jgi:hypothetical protein
VTFYYCNARSWALFRHPDTLLRVLAIELGGGTLVPPITGLKPHLLCILIA